MPSRGSPRLRRWPERVLDALEAPLVQSPDPGQGALEAAAALEPLLPHLERTRAELVRSIVAAAGIPVQVAGGVRTLSQVGEWFEAGAARVVLGTVAITDQALITEASSRFPGGIVVNLATKGGRVMLNGVDLRREGSGGDGDEEPHSCD